MPAIEINAYQEGLFKEAIAKMRANDPEYTDVLFEHPNAFDVAAIAEMLKINTTIVHVDLAHNNMGNFGAEYIADALRVNRNLTSVLLRYSEIDDEGAGFIVEALEGNYIPTRVSLVDNNISEANIARVNALVERNRAFLEDAVRDFVKGSKLTELQLQTLNVHSRSNDHVSAELFPQEVREEFINRDNRKPFIELMAKSTKDKMRDPARIMSEFIVPRDIVHFNQAVSPARLYFRGLVEVTPAIEAGFIQLEKNAGDFKKALSLPNNAVFIADAVNLGMPFAQIIENLDKIAADPRMKAFALDNPKKLGYLATLGKRQLDRAIGILNHPVLGEFVSKNPEQIATLAKVSGDPEKLMRAVRAVAQDPAIASVKAVVNASEERFTKASRAAKAAENRKGR